MSSRRRARTHDSDRFRGLREQTLYDDTFMYRPIIVERNISLRDFPELAPGFERLGWSAYSSFSGLDGPFFGFAIAELVREFYVNMHAIDLDARVLHSYVRSVDITLSPDVISEFLRLPRPAQPDFEPILDADGPPAHDIAHVLTAGRGTWVRETLPHRGLTEGYRMLHLYVVNSIDPAFHVTAVTARRGRILHSIVSGRTFDLPLFMFRLIAAASDSTSRSDSMPFGLFLTHFLRSCDVPLPEHYELLRMPNTLTYVSAIRSRTHTRSTLPSQGVPVTQAFPPQGIPVSPQGTADPFAPSSSTTPPAYDLHSLGTMLASIQGESREFQSRVFQRFDAIDARQAEMQTFQTEMDARLAAMQTRQNEMQLTLTQVQQNLTTFDFSFGDPLGSDFFPPTGGQGDGASFHTGGAFQGGGTSRDGDGAPGGAA